MGRPTRGEKELERILRMDNTQAYINRLKRAFEPFRRHLDAKHLHGWLEDLKKAYGNKQKRASLSTDSLALIEELNRVEKFLLVEAENTTQTIPFAFYEKVLFGDITDKNKFMGISHEIRDEHEGYLNPHAVLYIEPGAKIADAVQYLNLYGSEIDAELRKYLPKGSHLKKAIRHDAHKIDRDKEILKLRQAGKSYIKIQLHFLDKGENINLTTLRAVVKNANKRARK